MADMRGECITLATSYLMACGEEGTRMTMEQFSNSLATEPPTPSVVRFFQALVDLYVESSPGATATLLGKACGEVIGYLMASGRHDDPSEDNQVIYCQLRDLLQVVINELPDFPDDR